MWTRIGNNFRNFFVPTNTSRGSMIYSLFGRNMSLNKSMVKHSIPKDLNAEKMLTRDELIQKIPELIFPVKSNNVIGNTKVTVCWHPEVPFPYEMSKPMPLEVVPTDSHLKIQSLVPVREVFRKKHHKTVVKELMLLTHTTKHKWFGKYGMEKRKYVSLYMNPLRQRRHRKYL